MGETVSSSQLAFPCNRHTCIVAGTAFVLSALLTASFITSLTDIPALRAKLATPVSVSHVATNTTAATWLRSLITSANRDAELVRTERIGCREYQAGAQSCVYEGVICADTTAHEKPTRPSVYFLDDSRTDMEKVYDDEWCTYRFQSSDPRYFSSRHWPILNGTFAPQGSCLDAYYRTSESLLGRNISSPVDSTKGSGQNETAIDDLLLDPKIRWLDSMWLVDLDYVDNNHNNHLLMDIVWLLDVVLWQRSVDPHRRPGSRLDADMEVPSGALFSEGPRHVYLPQSKADFIKQTSRDVNRLLYALILERNIGNLYIQFGYEEMQTPPNKPRQTVPLLEAFPDLIQNETLVFHRDLQKSTDITLVCTPRFTSGAKVANVGHERVCRRMREKSYEFFGIPPLPMERLGQIYYPQPPKRIVVLQRHVSRKIGNAGELEKALRNFFEKQHGVEVEIVSTKHVQTAEEHVRVFSRAGVLITTHGSQSMGQIWMPRHSSLIEIMPVGYLDYAFNLLSESCRLWYYELRSMRAPYYSKEHFIEPCGENVPHMMNPCNDVKNDDVWVDIPKAVRLIHFALERMGYSIGPWMDFVQGS